MLPKVFQFIFIQFFHIPNEYLFSVPILNSHYILLLEKREEKKTVSAIKEYGDCILIRLDRIIRATLMKSLVHGTNKSIMSHTFTPRARSHTRTSHVIII